MLISIILVIIFLSLLVLVHEFGHFIAAKIFGVTVHEFGIGFPPAIIKKKIGETIYSINWIFAGGFVRLEGEERSEQSESYPNAPKESDSVRVPSDNSDVFAGSDREGSFSAAPWWRRVTIIIGGVFMNFIVGWLLISSIFAIGVRERLIVTQIAPDSPAATAGLKPGDHIKSIQGGSENLIIEGEDIATRFSRFVAKNAGQRLEIEVARGGSMEKLTATPRANPPQGEGALGIGIAEEGQKPLPLSSSLKEGFIFSGKIIGAFFLFIRDALIGRGDLEQVSGPVGIVKVTAQAAQLGLLPVIQLLALISLNLAVINILPIPALDGGRLFFLVIEKLKGSPVSARLERLVTMIGFALLISLIIVITVKDIIAL